MLQLKNHLLTVEQTRVMMAKRGMKIFKKQVDQRIGFYVEYVNVSVVKFFGGFFESEGACLNADNF